MFSLGPKVSFATTTLNYPIFAAEFDPYGRGYLVVGGGGGQGRSGVPNQISVLDVSNRATISSIVDIELTNDEDSVQSLGSLATKDGLITLAGINSSQLDQDAGRNEHFRAFDVKLPPRKRQKVGESVEKGSATLIGTRSIFNPGQAVKKEAYQRLIRLSPAQIKESGSKRVGAIASAMSTPAEIVVFSATTALPEPSDVLTRIETEQNEEVLDLDITVAYQNRFSLAWCTDYAIQEQTLEYDFDTKRVQKTPKGPRRIHQVPQAVGESSTAARPRFRCLRFLDAENVLALVNRPNKKGAELHIYHLYPTGPASTVLQMTLPPHIKQAASMDVCILDSDSNGNRQIVIAVAGQDISIETYVIDYKGTSGTFSRFHAFQTFRDVHKQQMTRICFSPFHAPPKSDSGRKASGEQFIRLASVSYGNTVVVDALPLDILTTKGTSRYVLVHPTTQARLNTLYILLVSFMVLVAAYIGRDYLRGEADIRTDFHNFWTDTFQEVFNQSTSSVEDIAQQMQASAASIVNGAVATEATASAASFMDSVVPADLQSSVASVVKSTLPTALPSLQKIQNLLDLHPEETKAVIIKDGHNSEVSFDVHHDREKVQDAKHWDDLREEQKHYWREKLSHAGHWAESEGETVLKGVLWSQYAGLVGAAAGEVLREL